MTAHNPETMLEPSDEWAGILLPDENILWQGRPMGGAPITLENIGKAVFGLFFAAFATLWMAMAMQAGGIFWMFGLLHFSVGMGMALKALFWKRIRLSNTWYTLTDHRAFIGTDLPLQGKRLRSWEIDSDTVLTFDAGPPASIGFGFEQKTVRSKKLLKSIGFERIAEGREVYDMMRKMRQRSLDAALRAKEDPH